MARILHHKIFDQKLLTTLAAVSLLAGLLTPLSFPQAAEAVETWEKLDKRMKGQVVQLSVGLKMKIKDSLWASLADVSPKYRYPVFSASARDPGYRVVSYGSAFPVKTIAGDKTKAYFLTNEHVVVGADEIIKESQRFYAGMRLYCEQTAAGRDVDGRFREILQIINLSTKASRSTAELSTYQATADAIWDTYETYLSKKADPTRALFNRYLSQVSVTSEVGYFLHAAGPVSQPPMVAKLFKVAKADKDPDIAILTVEKSTIAPMEFDTIPATEGQEIQVIGYPEASDQLDSDSANYYAPTFTSGRISRLAPRMLQVDAPITNGNSGGPVVSLRGKVLGVVAKRARTERGQELNTFGGAMTVQSIKNFAPDLFGTAP